MGRAQTETLKTSLIQLRDMNSQIICIKYHIKLKIFLKSSTLMKLNLMKFDVRGSGTYE